jgi:hypothetical protein
MEIEAEKRELAEGDEIMENLDLEVQLKDLIINHDDALDKSVDTWKTGLELHEDENSIFSSFDSKFDNQYQVLAITEDNSEEFDENNNPVLNPANINRGANHLAEGETVDSLVNREKIRLSVDEWNIIKTAVEHCTPIPNNASRNTRRKLYVILWCGGLPNHSRVRRSTRRKKLCHPLPLLVNITIFRKRRGRRHHRTGIFQRIFACISILAVLNLRGFGGSRDRNILNVPSLWERRVRHKKSMILKKKKQAESYKTNNDQRKLRRIKTVKRTAGKGCWELK